MRGTREERKRTIRRMLREFAGDIAGPETAMVPYRAERTVAQLHRGAREQGIPASLVTPRQVGEQLFDKMESMPPSLRMDVLRFLSSQLEVLSAAAERGPGDAVNALQSLSNRVASKLEQLQQQYDNRANRNTVTEAQLRKQIRSILKEQDQQGEKRMSPNALTQVKKMYMALTGNDLKGMTLEKLEAVKENLVDTLDTGAAGLWMGKQLTKLANKGSMRTLIDKATGADAEPAAKNI